MVMLAPLNAAGLSDGWRVRNGGEIAVAAMEPVRRRAVFPLTRSLQESNMAKAPKPEKSPKSGKSSMAAAPLMAGANNKGSADGDGSAVDDGLRAEISVEDDARSIVGDALMKAVADSYFLYAKTLGVHWNVQGPNFYGLHKLTDAQYNELHEAADAIAERIRALGKLAPTGFEAMRALTVIDNDAPHKPTQEMIAELVADNETVAKRMSEFAELADDHGDLFTTDMLVARIGKHEENAWMLRASLG
jgi:starvation-inducible DNA-binding protein